MGDPSEHALVLKAFALARGARGYVTGYVEWKARAAEIARGNLADLVGFTPEEIREKSIDFVNAGGLVRQCKEDREEWLEFGFSYRIVLPAPSFPRGVFVEFALNDGDPDDPAVLIVSAHRQGV